MYGVVVMLALSGSAESPDFGRKNCGGCTGCTGCCGVVVTGCTGCCGYTSCHGCNSCCGGRVGLFGRHKHNSCNGCSGCSGCCGGCSGVIYHSCSGCTGCCGGCSGVIYHGCAGAAVMPKDDGKVYSSVETNRATIVVSLPASASLVIDDYTTPSVQQQHTFITSSLNAGESRTISFKANVTVEGKQQTLTKQVTVTGGQSLNVNLAEGAAVAAK